LSDGTRAVVLEPARREDAAILANLLELYVHDLSEIFPVEIGRDGRFGYEHLPRYWEAPSLRFPFLVRADGALAGFVLATRGSPASQDPSDFDVAEFFVLRRYRRSGVGHAAATQLWDRIPGRWIVRVSTANRAGLPFWRRVVSEYTAGVFVEDERPGSPHPWRVLSFETPSVRRPAT
jgi:predicted acetyltransferase